MTIIDSFFDLFTKREDSSYVYDLDLFQETSKNAHLKRMAIEVVLNFVGRTVAQSTFRVMSDNERFPSENWEYKLNVRPNPNQSANDFWQKFIYKLMFDNEVLVVLNETDDLLIADTFTVHEYANYPNRFSQVTVGDFTFGRTFEMNDVLYLTYNNEKFQRYLESLFSDYGEMFGRLIKTNLRKNQLRGTVPIESTMGMKQETADNLQQYIDTLYKSFDKNDVAIVPLPKGFSYEEVSSGGDAGASFSEILEVQNSYIDNVAKSVGVPPALIHGDMADLTANRQAYIEFCIRPLIHKINDELNAKLFSQLESTKHKAHVEINGIDKPNVFNMAESIDKLISSGVFTINEIREKLGEEQVDDERMNQHFITKNYETLRGGERDNEDNQN